MADDTLEVQPRTVIGKKVRRLRREGTVPGNVYGRHLDSVAVQLATREATQLLRSRGLNNLITLQIAGEAETRPVVVRAVGRHPASRALQHIDFYQVDLTRVIQAAVPVIIVGEAPAVQLHGGVLLHVADTMLIEALPAAMPAQLEVSVEALTELDTRATIADVQLPPNVRVLDAPDTVLARVARPRLIAEDEEKVLEGEELPEGEEAPEAEQQPGETDAE